VAHRPGIFRRGDRRHGPGSRSGPDCREGCRLDDKFIFWHRESLCCCKGAGDDSSFCLFAILECKIIKVQPISRIKPVQCHLVEMRFSALFIRGGFSQLKLSWPFSSLRLPLISALKRDSGIRAIAAFFYRRDRGNGWSLQCTLWLRRNARAAPALAPLLPLQIASNRALPILPL
jgi:hypothetical protein